MNITERAKKLSPAPLWTKWGYEIKYAGNEIRVYKDLEEGCLYRSVQNSAGYWISGLGDTGRISEGVGDNISLVQHFTKRRGVAKSFIESVSYILYICKDEQLQENKVASKEDLLINISLPLATKRGDAQGRAYLGARGISLDICKLAEEKDFISFLAGNNDYSACVLFKGYCKSELAYASKRCVESLKAKDSSDKKDMFGSNKTWVPFIKGSKTVIFTEGGINALSILEAFNRAGRPMPTVIMTAGSGNTKWQNNDEIVKILKTSNKIFFINDNDAHLSDYKRNLVVQSKNKQAEIASSISGLTAGLIEISDPYGDLNDLLNSDYMPEELELIINKIDSSDKINTGPSC